MQAVQKTKALIITSGTSYGVTKAVGSAVNDGQSYNWDTSPPTRIINCIGITPWGYVAKRDKLIREDLQVRI